MITASRSRAWVEELKANGRRTQRRAALVRMDERAAFILFDLVYTGKGGLYIVYQHNFGAVTTAAADTKRVGGARHDDFSGCAEQVRSKRNCDRMVAGTDGGHAAGESRGIKVKHIRRRARGLKEPVC